MPITLGRGRHAANVLLIEQLYKIAAHYATCYKAAIFWLICKIPIAHGNSVDSFIIEFPQGFHKFLKSVFISCESSSPYYPIRLAIGLAIVERQPINILFFEIVGNFLADNFLGEYI